MLMHTSLICSLFIADSILLYTTNNLSVLLLMGVWIVFNFWLIVNKVSVNVHTVLVKINALLFVGHT
jgi:hypothetical protein